MIALIRLALAIFVALFQSKARFEAEKSTLRHQLIVLRRKLPGRGELANGDRTLFVWLYRQFPSVRAAVLVQPETLILHPRACRSGPNQRSSLAGWAWGLRPDRLADRSAPPNQDLDLTQITDDLLGCMPFLGHLLPPSKSPNDDTRWTTSVGAGH